MYDLCGESLAGRGGKQRSLETILRAELALTLEQVRLQHSLLPDPGPLQIGEEECELSVRRQPLETFTNEAFSCADERL